MREPKIKDALPRWLREQADYLENIIHYGPPDTPEVFFEGVAVRETLGDVRRVCARFGISVETGDVTDPTSALVIVGRVFDQFNTLPDLLTVKQAAERLNVSARAVYDLVECGRLRCSRIGRERGTIRIRPDDLEDITPKTKPVYKHLTI